MDVTARSVPSAFVRAHTRVRRPSSVPEVRLHVADVGQVVQCRRQVDGQGQVLLLLQGTVAPHQRRQPWTVDVLEDHVRALVDALNRAKPSGAKGTYIKKISLSSTMGPGFKVDAASVNA